MTKLSGQKTIIDLEAPFTDERGMIQNLVHHPLGSAVLITSKAGSIRAEHWHKEDFHYCYVIKGELIYSERPLNSEDEPTVTTISAGQLFYTGPRVEHSMYFTMDTIFLTLGGLSRTHEDYENDLVRLTNRLTDTAPLRRLISENNRCE